MTSPRSKPEAEEIAEPYELMPREQVVLDAARARRKAMPPPPSMKLREKGDLPLLDIDHPDLRVAADLLMEAPGTTDTNFFGGSNNSTRQRWVTGQER